MAAPSTSNPPAGSAVDASADPSSVATAPIAVFRADTGEAWTARRTALPDAQSAPHDCWGPVVAIQGGIARMGTDEVDRALADSPIPRWIGDRVRDPKPRLGKQRPRVKRQLDRNRRIDRETLAAVPEEGLAL